VNFGGESRVIVEFDDDALEVFYVLDVTNPGEAPVQTGPLVIELPAGAQDVAILEGSSPQAAARGRQVTVTGPFAPGRTPVQVAYRLPIGGDRLALNQVFPARLDQLALMVQQVGGVQVTSKQIASAREVPADGRTYIMAMGPAVPAGSALSLAFAGLPHRPAWPRTLALVLAIGILGIGAWAAVGRTDREAAGRQALERRREAMFGELVRLEDRARQGSLDQRTYEARRADLVAGLERIYGELDTVGGGSGDEGLAR
jgi:hypothetical protein